MNQIWATAYFCKYVLIGRVMSICLSIAHGHFGTTERRFQIREQRLEQRAEGQCHSTRIISYLTLYI